MKLVLSPQALAVVNLAKKTGKLRYSPQSPESFDLANHKRAGFSAEDITGFWSPGVFSYITGNFYNFFSAWKEFGFIEAFRFLSLKTRWSGWVWVVDALSLCAEDVLDEKIKFMSPIQQKEARRNYKTLVGEVTESEIAIYLNKYFYQVSDWMWIAKSDPTVILYNQNFKPFSLQSVKFCVNG
jgi:hypothetical protein